MDDIVKQAMAKWPNVPACYGWLALDARGNWRMRDERAQANNLAGEKIVHAALLGFINRNYTHDATGRWYFQNGPQCVYVNLEATPYIARTDPEHNFILHTGELMEEIDAAWMTEAGRLILRSHEKIALLDDRDMARVLPDLRLDDVFVDDEKLLDWLSKPRSGALLSLQIAGHSIPVAHIASDAVSANFGFIQTPQADRS
ncbi:DUF2946 family protein [soil metagenome]